LKAVTWHGKRDVRVDNVPDPTIQEPTDAIVRITTTNICGSDLHLYEVLGPFIDEGYVLGHEPMGIVEEVGPEVTHVRPGDRVVIPFNVSCGHCWMCDRGLQSQCETTQVHEQGMGSTMLGFAQLYGNVPGGQAEFLRVPQAQYGPVKVPEEGEGMPDERFVYLSDVLPNLLARRSSTLASRGAVCGVYGAGTIRQMSARIRRHKATASIAVARARAPRVCAPARVKRCWTLREHDGDLPRTPIRE
jgi:threonine dehydrogenase-like Zn-dependent dehydrogenase